MSEPSRMSNIVSTTRRAADTPIRFGVIGAGFIARWFAANPARTFNVNRKGSICAGNDADLVVFDPEETFNVDVESLEHKNKISPYHGRTLRGVVHTTILRGRTVDRNSMHGHMIART